jgi:hypothetical protein
LVKTLSSARITVPAADEGPDVGVEVVVVVVVVVVSTDTEDCPRHVVVGALPYRGVPMSAQLAPPRTAAVSGGAQLWARANSLPRKKTEMARCIGDALSPPTTVLLTSCFDLLLT